MITRVNVDGPFVGFMYDLLWYIDISVLSFVLTALFRLELCFSLSPHPNPVARALPHACTLVQNAVTDCTAPSH